MHDDYQRGLRQGRMMSRIERCVCTLDENGDGPVDVCEMHKAWLADAIKAEREECAKICDDLDDKDEPTAAAARMIRARGNS